MNHTSNLLRFGAPILFVSIAIVVVIASVGAGNGEDDDRDQPASGDERQVQEVAIDRFDVNLAESFPVQVFIAVEGHLPDPCWESQEPVVEREGDRFVVTIMAERDPDEMCAQVIEDYSESIGLGDVEPGSYAVEVNGLEQTFDID
jgi:hypothetical protein